MDQATSPRIDLAGLRIDEAHRNHDPSGRRRWPLALFALLLLAGLAIAAFFLTRPPEVEVVEARPPPAGAAAALLNASGYVTPLRRATVAAKITAQVSEVLIEEGMKVEAGQVLARLDDAGARRQLDSARAEREVARAAIAELQVNLENAERDLARTRELHAEGMLSDQALDAAGTAAAGLRARLAVARRQVEAAEAGVAMAEETLDNTIVRAPYAGMVVSKDAQPGEMVSPISGGSGYTRTGIATIVDMDSLEIEVDVSESYITRVVPGQPVEATLDAYPDWRIPGRVRTLIPTADRQKATVKVRVAFDQLDPRILPDMGVKVAFLPAAGGDGGAAEKPPVRALMPQSAIRRAGDQAYVFLVRDGRLERRAVTTGEARGGDVEVLAGVAPGDPVVADGPADLADGQRVRHKSAS